MAAPGCARPDPLIHFNMRLVSYSIPGEQGFGVIQGDGIVSMSRHSPYLDLLSALRSGGLADLNAIAQGQATDFALEDVQLLPPVPNPGKIICVGLNYRDHVEESGRTVTAHPALFCRYPESQVGHGANLVKPLESDKFDFEGELALVIGKRGRRIRALEAMGHIAGYTCYNDGSIRDWQHHTSQFLSGKNFASTGAFGPWLVTAEDIPDPSRLRLRTLLNGAVMQEATVDMMITSIPELIAYISTFMTLEPGDVIVTGTPGGVGTKRTPPVYMHDGDIIEIEIDRIGTLRNQVVAENL
jgi:2-keto-4-pentenoate hydratase/2-oxohepta-3-ene-1,7-dioic acid hydratase in catechol pathway